MAGEKGEGLDVKDQGTPKEEPAKKDEVNTEDLIEQAKKEAREEAYKEVEGKFKKELSTRDQTITKLQKDINATKSDEERAKIEAAEDRKNTLVQYARLAAEKLGLDETVSDFISGETIDEIRTKLESFQKVKEAFLEPLNKEIKTLQDANKALEEEIKILRASGAAPKAGAGADEKKVSRADFDNMSDVNKAAFIKSGGAIED